MTTQKTGARRRRITPRAIERAILELVEARHPKTACPSEVARQLDPDDWRPWMQAVRDAAVRLRARGRIEVEQRGAPVDPATARGPIRLRLAHGADARLAHGADARLAHGADARLGRTGDAYRGIDFRAEPARYRVGRGEQGVLTAEPYKSELLPLWRFKTEAEARTSSKALYAAFRAYREQDDFVGMDMARKFVQMGFTRARRYANHKSGRKYDEDGQVAALDPDPEKARAAEVFSRVRKRIESDPKYRAAREAWTARKA